MAADRPNWTKARALIVRQVGAERAQTWGTTTMPGTKPLEGATGSLQSEVLQRESSIGERQTADGQAEVVREVGVVQVTVTRRDQRTGVQQRLVEDRQEFHNGTTRRRGFEYLGEKLHAGEEPIEGAYRAVDEELGLPLQKPEPGQQERMVAGTAQTTRKDSESYPGLHSEYTVYSYSVELSADEAARITVNAQGEHEERQRDKTTFFAWRDVK